MPCDDVLAMVLALLCRPFLDSSLAQDLAPRAYLITPVHSNAVTLSYSFFTGNIIFDGAVPITGATAKVNVPILSSDPHSFAFWTLRKLTASLPYGVGNFRGHGDWG